MGLSDVDTPVKEFLLENGNKEKGKGLTVAMVQLDDASPVYQTL